MSLSPDMASWVALQFVYVVTMPPAGQGLRTKELGGILNWTPCFLGKLPLRKYHSRVACLISELAKLTEKASMSCAGWLPLVSKSTLL